MILSEQNRENAVTYGLAAYGILRGLVMVYAVEPMVAARRERQHHVVEPLVDMTVHLDNVVPFETARNLGSVAVEPENLAA